MPTPAHRDALKCSMAHALTPCLRGRSFSLLGDEGGRNPLKLDGIVPLMVSE